MPGVPRELAEHKLNADPKVRHVKQSLWPFNKERRRAIAEEVQRLLAAGFIRPIKYSKWLANPVLVDKKNGTWRMCIDYTNLNNACPKGAVRPPADRPNNRFHHGLGVAVFPRRLFWVQLDQNGC